MTDDEQAKRDINVNYIANGNESAKECINYLMDTFPFGLEGQVADRVTLPYCKKKQLGGMLLGLLWERSEKDLLIFTILVKTVPAELCTLIGMMETTGNKIPIKLIDDTVDNILINIKKGIKLNMYSLELLSNTFNPTYN